MSKTKIVLGGSIVLVTLLATTAVGQNRPEFSRDYWSSKRLPDSMKGISPDDLAAIAKMNEAARLARAAEKASPQDGAVRRAGGALDFTKKKSANQVMQTGAASPLIGPRRPGADSGILSKFTGRRPNVAPQPLRMAGRPQGVAAPRQAMQQVVPPASPEIPRLLEQARAAKQAGNLAAARDAYRKVLKIEPYNREVLVSAGRVEHAMGEIDNAIQAYEYLLRIQPNHSVALNDLGLCWARKGDMPAALKSLQSAVESDPRSIRYRNNLAKVLIETNQIDSAVQVLTQLRGDALGKAGVGALLAERGRDDEARAYLEQALVVDPSLVAAREKLNSLSKPVEKIATASEALKPTPMTIQAGVTDSEIQAPELSIQR